MLKCECCGGTWCRGSGHSTSRHYRNALARLLDGLNQGSEAHLPSPESTRNLADDEDDHAMSLKANSTFTEDRSAARPQHADGSMLDGAEVAGIGDTGHARGRAEPCSEQVQCADRRSTRRAGRAARPHPVDHLRSADRRHQELCPGLRRLRADERPGPRRWCSGRTAPARSSPATTRHRARCSLLDSS